MGRKIKRRIRCISLPPGALNLCYTGKAWRPTGAMNTPADMLFGPLLKRYRMQAGLTQEALADRAGVSRRGIQALERGENKPQKETAQRLVTALGLTNEARDQF